MSINMISHPRQCAGCNNLILTNEEVEHFGIDQLEYVCEMVEDGEFIPNCEENTAYSGGSYERVKQGFEQSPHEEYVNKLCADIYKANIKTIKYKKTP